MTSPTAGNVYLDPQPGDELPKGYSPFSEIGITGLRRVSGYVEEEFLPALRGRKAVQIYREMADNDAISAAFIYAVTNLLRQVEWRVESASNNPEDKLAAEFVEQCMDDMSHSWSELIAEILTMVTYGWSWHEICYKRRMGPWEKDAKRKSKYTDGKIGWRKIPIRAQETLYRWIFDDKGGVQGMVQIAPPNYISQPLPIDKSLLFRTTATKNNPEGYSLLRGSYQSWYYKKRMMETEAIGMERDLAGMPIVKVPAAMLNARPGTKEADMLKAFRKMVRNVRRDEQEGVIFPMAYDDDKNPLYDFELLTSGGSRQFTPDPIIQRYATWQLITNLADFLLVGHDNSSGGSYAMHTDKTGLFRNAINSISQSIADVFNRHAIPRLFAANAWKPNELPKIVPNDVDPPDLTQLAGFMTAMTQAGMQWFPDPELEKFLRDAARLPQLDETTEQIRETQQRQQNIIDLANQRMQALQLDMQAHQGAMQLQQQSMGLAQQQQSMQAQDLQMQQQAQMDPNAPDPVAQAKADSIAQESQLKNQQLASQAKFTDAQNKQNLSHDQKLKALQLQAERAKMIAARQGSKQQLSQGDQAHRAKLKQGDQAHRQNLTLKEQAAKAALRNAAAKAAAKKAAPKGKVAPKKGPKK